MSSRFKEILGALCLIGLGAIFIFAAAIKAADPALFAQTITSYGITPASWSPFLAHLLVISELVLGAAAMLLLLPRLTSTGFLIMLAVFIPATAWAWSQGNISECGCFGRASSRGPLAVILEDALFVVMAVIALRWAKLYPPAKIRWLIFAALLPVLLASTWIGPRLPVDALVTPVHAGSDLSNIAIDGLRKPVSEGQVLLAIYGTECGPCDASVTALDEIAGGAPELHVAAVLGGTKREARAFRVQHVPTFPIGHTPSAVLRQYYRRLPVFVLMKDGIVESAWWGEAPTLQQVQSAIS